MKTLFCAAATALLLATPAAAFDTSTCKSFLTGTWNSEGEAAMGDHTMLVKTHSVYKSDGTFTATQSMEMPGEAPMSQQLSGAWDAKPGPTADSCEASVTANEFGTRSVVLTVVDENTVKDPNGRESHRQPE